MLAPPPGSLSDLIYQHPWLVSSSVLGTITVARKIILKGLQTLLELFRAFCDFMLGIETAWHEYQGARPRKNGEDRSKNRLAAPQIKLRKATNEVLPA
jgi:hypothetical protein